MRDARPWVVEYPSLEDCSSLLETRVVVNPGRSFVLRREGSMITVHAESDGERSAYARGRKEGGPALLHLPG